jgi:hypothetical protein
MRVWRLQGGKVRKTLMKLMYSTRVVCDRMQPYLCMFVPF